MVHNRPKIKLTLSPLDKGMELAGNLFLVMMWGLAIYTFLKLPAIIPVHFNASGKANDYGSKMILLILPVLATIIYAGLTQLNKYPHIFNYITTITKSNAQKQYTLATRMLRYLKLAILLIFSLVTLFVYLTTIGVTNGLGYWFLPFTFAVLLIPTAITISQSFKKENNTAKQV